MIDGFNNGDFNLKLPIVKIRLCQIKVLYGIQIAMQTVCSSANFLGVVVSSLWMKASDFI